VSLKSSQRTCVPMLNAACAGSSSKLVPGTVAPPGSVAPGTSGPRCFTQSGNFIASIAQASESSSMYRAVS
jgi:hypothetical protein